MTLKLELDGLLYGLLTVATIASVTSIAARLTKRILLVPHSFDARERHLDSRDALANLISSWRIVPSLFERDQSSYNRYYTDELSTTSSRLRVRTVFICIAILTVAAETVLILSTGTIRSELLLPDVQKYTFLGRHLGIGHDLGEITEKVGANKCIVIQNATFHERLYVEYSESLCMSKKPRRRTGPLRTFELQTEVSKFDEVKLWFGNVTMGKKKINKKTFATASAFVMRRVHYVRRQEKRVLDKNTALRMARVVEKLTQCKMVDAREAGNLDSTRLKRPAKIANYTCASPISFERLVDSMGEACLQGYGKFEYGKSRMKYHVGDDSWVVNAQRKLHTGVRLSKAYEPAWFAAMSAVTLLGVVLWAWDNTVSGSVYPDIGLLTLVSELSRLHESCINEIYRTPVALYANDVEMGSRDVAATQSRGVQKLSFLSPEVRQQIVHGYYIDGNINNPGWNYDHNSAALQPRFAADMY